jgi:hypothetical protein
VSLDVAVMNKKSLISTVFLTTLLLVGLISPLRVRAAQQTVNMVGRGKLTEIGSGDVHRISLFLVLEATDLIPPIIGGDGWGRINTQQSSKQLRVTEWHIDLEAKTLNIIGSMGPGGEVVFYLHGEIVPGNSQHQPIQVELTGSIQKGDTEIANLQIPLQLARGNDIFDNIEN